MKINKISPLKSEFFKVLEFIALMPKILYCYGEEPKTGAKQIENKQSSLIDNSENGFSQNKRIPCVAIVGARKNTKYGEEIAYRAAFELAKAGIVIISGLAYGIDSIAHRAALDAGGVTIAVLGTPIDEIYPKCHEGLAKEIVSKGGMVVFEYGPGDKAESLSQAKVRFLERNRLISGLSDAVVVIEAAERSGTLNTASHALEQGKDLYAVPGDITKRSSAGCNRLLAQGAFPFLSSDDILARFMPEKINKKKKNIRYRGSDDEMKILEAIKSGARSNDEILQIVELDASAYMRAMAILELKGVVKNLELDGWVLI